MVENIVRNAACSGEVWSTSTSKVGPHRASEAPPVWVRPVRHPAATSFGYLNSSIQRVLSASARAAGKAISFRPTLHPPPSEFPAPSPPPLPLTPPPRSCTP